MSPPSVFCLAPLLAAIGAWGQPSLSELARGAEKFSASRPVMDADRISTISSPLPKRACMGQRACDDTPIPSASEAQVQLIRFQDGGGAMQTCSSESARPGERINACTALLLSSVTEPDERAHLYAQRAMAYYRAGENEMAIADFSLALELDPALLLALNGRCWIRAVEGVELEGARRDCDAAIALDPEFHEALDSRAMVSMREGRWNDAWQDFNAAVSIRGDVAVYVYGRGLASLALGNSEAGNADLNRARALDRQIDRFYRELGLDPALPPLVQDHAATNAQDN